jgi:hypothetical protein
MDVYNHVVWAPKEAASGITKMLVDLNNSVVPMVALCPKSTGKGNMVTVKGSSCHLQVRVWTRRIDGALHPRHACMEWFLCAPGKDWCTLDL